MLRWTVVQALAADLGLTFPLLKQLIILRDFRYLVVHRFCVARVVRLPGRCMVESIPAPLVARLVVEKEMGLLTVANVTSRSRRPRTTLCVVLTLLQHLVCLVMLTLLVTATRIRLMQPPP